MDEQTHGLVPISHSEGDSLCEQTCRDRERESLSER